jgi:hypothetical protein
MSGGDSVREPEVEDEVEDAFVRLVRELTKEELEVRKSSEAFFEVSFEGLARTRSERRLCALLRDLSICDKSSYPRVHCLPEIGLGYGTIRVSLKVSSIIIDYSPRGATAVKWIVFRIPSREEVKACVVRKVYRDAEPSYEGKLHDAIFIVKASRRKDEKVEEVEKAVKELILKTGLLLTQELAKAKKLVNKELRKEENDRVWSSLGSVLR